MARAFVRLGGLAVGGQRFIEFFGKARPIVIRCAWIHGRIGMHNPTSNWRRQPMPDLGFIFLKELWEGTWNLQAKTSLTGQRHPLHEEMRDPQIRLHT